jgi:biotin transport system substrate-specific component
MAAISSSPTLLSTVASRRGATLHGDAAQPSFGIRALSVAFFTLLTAAAAQISVPLPFTQVPFTFQPVIVLLAGLTLGSRLGLTSQVLYLAAGIAGLPVFAASATLAPGVLRLLGPTGGYLMAYPFVAFLVGYLAERGLGRRYATSVIAMLIGLAAIYTAGALWLGLFARVGGASAAIGLRTAVVTGVVPFILADVIKVIAAAAVVPAMWRLVGRARGL